MAQFSAEIPQEVLNDLKKIHDNTEKIFGEMTKAGADVVEKNVKASVPVPALRGHVKKSKVYRTPTDGGINTKVYFNGYIPFKGNRSYFSRSGGNGKKYVTKKGIPADFIAIVFEYGRSGLPFPKKPFFRKAYKKGEIEKAMLEAQKKASGGILDE